MATTYKSTQMTNFTAGPPATTLKPSEHNRVHMQWNKYTTTGAETTNDVIQVGFLPLDAKVHPFSRVHYGATVSGYISVGDAGDATRYKAKTDVTSAGSFALDYLTNLDWEVDSTDNQTILLTVSGTLAADIDIYVGLAYTY